MKNRILSIPLAVALVLSVGLIGCGGEEIPEYSLIISSTEGGLVTTPGEDTFTYDEGTVVNLVAAAGSGYHFVNWTGDVSSIADVNAASTTITMNGDYSVMANFAALYQVTISSTEGGSVTTPGEDAYTYDKGEVVNLVAVADEGYQFINWTGDVSTIADANAASTTITMNDGYSITANFAGTIQDWYDLDAIRNNLGGSYVLMNDLDSTTAGYAELASGTADDGRGWEPVGTIQAQFMGSLDGQGYEIKDLFIDRPGESQVGLFRALGWGGVIENLGVMSIAVAGGSTVGCVVGVSRGLVSGSYSVGAVTGSATVGGLLGVNMNLVTNCYYAGSVRGYGPCAGGLVGESYGDGVVLNSYCTGSVTGDSEVGGLVGRNVRTIVSNSYSKSSVTGGWQVGGLVGQNSAGTVDNCYSTGSVTGSDGVGGLVGRIGTSSSISSSYATGHVTGTGPDVGGLVGGSNQGIVMSSFWDTQTSEQAASDGGTGKTTAEMQDITTFTAWDISTVGDTSTRNPACSWNIVDGGTYPFLSWEL